MEEGRPSATAIGAAMARAAHFLWAEDPKIFQDPLALRLSGLESEAAGDLACAGHPHGWDSALGRAPRAHAIARGDPGNSHHRRLASPTHPPPSAAGLRGGVQPPRGRKQDCQPAEPGGGTPALQRLARGRCATHHGGDGAQRGHGPPDPARAPDAPRPKIPPIAPSQVTQPVEKQGVNKLVTTTYEDSRSARH